MTDLSLERASTDFGGWDPSSIFGTHGESNNFSERDKGSLVVKLDDSLLNSSLLDGKEEDKKF